MKRIVFIIMFLGSLGAYSQTCPTMHSRVDSLVACKLKVKNLSTGILKSNSTGNVSIANNSDLPTMTATVGGAVPTPPNNTTTFLRGDGTFAVPTGGSGTVTSVSVTTANGVSGSVATATTTPAIMLTLGAITPTSINGVTLSGASTPDLTVTGTATVSGTNTGDQTSVTGNAGTATALQTGRTISLTGDVSYTSPSFDGTGNITASSTVTKINGTALSGLGTGILKNTTGTGVPSIAIAADFPTLNQNTTGSAATLTTPRNINGTAFDGSGNITITASAGTLTGATLNSTVINSSLTSVGTLTDLTVTNPINADITGNSATVTTNANLTGDVTSSGNATSYSAVVPSSKGGAGTINGILKANGSGTVSLAVVGTDYSIPATISADGTDADFTAVVNSVKYLPASTLTTDRTITIPAGSNGDFLEIYNNETGHSWLLSGSSVYLSDGITIITSLYANTNHLIRKVSGKWRILN